MNAVMHIVLEYCMPPYLEQIANSTKPLLVRCDTSAHAWNDGSGLQGKDLSPMFRKAVRELWLMYASESEVLAMACTRTECIC